MVHTRTWPRISPSTKIYFCCHFRGALTHVAGHKGDPPKRGYIFAILAGFFVYVFQLIRDVILFGGSSPYTVRDGVSMLREIFAGALPAHPARM
jgi:hypothetical protein